MSSFQPIHATDSALVARITGGDRTAEDLFAHRFSRHVESLVRRAGAPVQDCQDIAQEAMLTALDQLRRGLFRGEGQFGGWLARIVRGKTMDYWRERCSAVTLALDEPGEMRDLVEAIPAPMADYELVASVREILRTLPQQHRIILLLKRAEGFTLEEISQMMSLTMGQVGGKLYAAEEMFRRG